MPNQPDPDRQGTTIRFDIDTLAKMRAEAKRRGSTFQAEAEAAVIERLLKRKSVAANSTAVQVNATRIQELLAKASDIAENITDATGHNQSSKARTKSGKAKRATPTALRTRK